MRFITSKYDLPDIFIDALVSTDYGGDLIFLSAWGGESRIRQMQAQMSLPKSDRESLSDFWTEDFGTTYIRKIDNFEARLARVPQSIFAHLTQIWIYDKLLLKPDRANQKFLMLKHQQETAAAFDERVWQAILKVCHIPLLGAWQSLLKDFAKQKWLKKYQGFGVDACEINLASDKVKSFISRKIRAGELPI